MPLLNQIRDTIFEIQESINNIPPGYYRIVNNPGSSKWPIQSIAEKTIYHLDVNAEVVESGLQQIFARELQAGDSFIIECYPDSEVFEVDQMNANTPIYYHDDSRLTLPPGQIIWIIE